MEETSDQETSTMMPTEAESSLKSWEAKEIKLVDVPSLIPNGSTVYIGSTAATPEAVLHELVINTWNSSDIQIIQMLPGGNLPHLEENIDRFRTLSFFSYRTTMYYNPDDHAVNANATAPIREGLADYKPMSLSSIERLLREKIISVDVAVIKVTPPHKGFVSLGFGVDCTADFIKYAKIVIAEVNSYMPWTEGPSKIHTSQIDHWILNNERLKTTDELWPEFMKNISTNRQPDNVMSAIGKNIAKEINDGATLKFGWNPIVFSVIPYLYEHKNLGLHTDMFVDVLYDLQKHGIINNTMKTINTGRSVVSQAHGPSDEIYDYLDRNPAIEVHPTSYVNDPQVMGKIDNLVVILAAFKIDITGQVTTDSIGHKFYAGVWSTSDSVHGARLSKHGKLIVALPSKSSHGRSNIMFDLPAGTGISITRSDVEYVITEYGTAYLYGKSIRERCLALIEIAHPDFRAELFNLAKENHYLSQSQPGKSFSSTYPEKFECYFTTTTGKSVFIRPIKAADEDMLRAFFHKLSDHSVYLRYFRRLRSMSHRVLQKYTDLDYANDMALLALHPIEGTNNGDTNNIKHTNGNAQKTQYEIVAIAQWMSDPLGNIPEIAFQVRDDWQGEGLGSHLLLRMVQVSKSFFGVHRFKADVLGENKAMRRVFEKSGVPYTTKFDFGVVTYIFDFNNSIKA